MKYWLSRAPGSSAEGPFLLGQLKTMFDGGQLTAVAQVCREGEEDWVLLHEELEHERGLIEQLKNVAIPRQKVGRVKKIKKSGCVPIFIFGVGVVLLFAFFPLGILTCAVAILVDVLNHHFACSECGNSLPKQASLCPTCKALLK